MTHQSALYIVPTPIGNLEDITQRALTILREVDVIAAEDTRHSGKLLQHYGIATPLISYHDHSHASQAERIFEKILAGQSVALISDAGTPLISDPGYRLVTAAREQGITVVPLPGPCALIAALSAAGLPSDRFSFEGFPPAKSQGRKNGFSLLIRDARTLIFYESAHRIDASLRDMRDVFGDDRRCVVARELTKTFETFLDGSLATVHNKVVADANQRKGEFVVMLEGYVAPAESAGGDHVESGRILSVLLEELSVKQAASLAAKITGEKKNKLYQLALERNSRA